ncbi:protein phosphatase 1 regulatory subunit 3A [Pimephales promelas]|nr:protein phosphatase 1 regulatory subunit 3A [Pimephales promelas]
MSVEELAPSTVSYNMDICRDWMMKNKEEIIKLEKTVERISDGSSAEESEEEPEPPPVAARRKVSFADAFGLDLVSVKEYDNRDVSRPEVDGIEGDEYYISCLFTLPVLNGDMEVRLQKQKLELERIELLPGSTTIRGIVRVLNLCFHKAVYIRVTLDGWQSHSELLAEYVPGSSNGETDCFSFLLVLTPPFQVEGVRVEFCLRYESDVGTFWDNNGGTNYIVFCHQRRRSDQREKEKESEREKLVEESNQKSIRSCLKAISKKIYIETTPAEASGGISEQDRPKTEEEAGITPYKSIKDCCKTLADRRRKRQAARLAHVQDYFAQKAIETQNRCNSNTNERRLGMPSRTDLPVLHSRQGHEQSEGPSGDQVLGYQPRLIRVACSALGSEPERAGREFEASRDRQTSHHEHTRGSLSQDTTKASSGDETRTAHDTDTQNSEAGDGISPEEFTGSFDTSKVKENTHRAVKDTLTFTPIGDVSLTNRQAERSSSEREDINKDDSEEQVEIREFYRGVHEEETESSAKGRDETTTDHSAEIQSVNESDLCMSNENLELLKIEERRFEANEGLETTAEEGESAGKRSESKRELVEEKEFELLEANYPAVSTDPSKHLLHTTSAKKGEVTSPDEDFELGKTLRNFQEPQRPKREGEHRTPLPSMHLSWVDGSSGMLSWWREFCSIGHMTKALVYAILFVIFITAYLYDLPTWLGLSVFSVLVVQPGHETASGWGC